MSTFPPTTTVFNDGYIAETYEAYRRDPASVDESWRQFFRIAEALAGITGGAGSGRRSGAPPQDGRRRGADRRDPPVRSPRRAARSARQQAARRRGADPGVPRHHRGRSSRTSRRARSAIDVGNGGRRRARAARRLLRQHRLRVRAPRQRGGAALVPSHDGGRRAHAAAERRREARRAAPAHARSMASSGSSQRAYLGNKRFSIEGTDVLVPMIDEAIARGAPGGRATGRDRHGAPRPPQRAHPRARQATSRSSASSRGGTRRRAPTASTGDVKYHLGYENERKVGDDDDQAGARRRTRAISRS